MKSWRICLLLLLAVLLPVRGPVAGAMLCSISTPGVQVEMTVGQGEKDHQAMGHSITHDNGSVHSHMDGGLGHNQNAAHDHGVADKCNMCTVYCSLTPLISEAPVFVEPTDLRQVEHTAPSALPPSHLSGRQERPPRTI